MLHALLLVLLLNVNITVLPGGNAIVVYEANVTPGVNELLVNPFATGIVVTDAVTGNTIPFEHVDDKLNIYVNTTNVTRVRVTYVVPNAAVQLDKPGWYMLTLPEFKTTIKYYAGRVEVPVEYHYYYFHPIYAAIIAASATVAGIGIGLVITRRERGKAQKTQENEKPKEKTQKQ